MAEEHAYNKSYSSTPNLFGAEPDEVLVKHLHMMDRSQPVLDVGSGQGRHALFLAQAGYEVIALDPSAVAIQQLELSAEKEELVLRCKKGTIEDFDAGVSRFGTILVFGLIQILTWEKIHAMTTCIDELTAPGGVVILTGWTVDDSSFERVRETGESVGANSYRLPNGDVRTYLEPNQILDLFSGWEAVYHWEGLGEWHRHGDSEPERHARVEAVLRKSST